MQISRKMPQLGLCVYSHEQCFFSRRPSNSSPKHTILPGVPPVSTTANVETMVKGVGGKNVKRNRRVNKRMKSKVVNRKLKLIGVNSAGLSSKLNSFDKVLQDRQPGVFFVQETKMNRAGKIKTENSKNYQIYELVLKSSKGGGLAIRVLHDLNPVWIGEGCDQTESLSV